MDGAFEDRTAGSGLGVAKAGGRTSIWPGLAGADEFPTEYAAKGIDS
jgi:hypothetical protein